ncbi:MAG: hypothetical protein LRY55_02570 [Leadbetterella sp.]|nr:hypothetical protein [Leadbetterella sp.]
MKNKGGILLLFAALLLLSLYYLARTWKINDIRKDAASYATVNGQEDPAKKTILPGFPVETESIPGLYGRKPDQTGAGPGP